MQKIPIRPDGLQLDEDRAFQERYWTAERVAWIAFALLIAAALLGLTGAGGPLSTARAEVGAARVEYPTISRWSASDVLRIRLPDEGTGVVTLGTGFVESFEIEQIQPTPVASASTSAGLRLEFDIDGENAAPVIFSIRALSAGFVDYVIAVEGQGMSHLSTFILP